MTDPTDGGTVTYHRADYRPGTDEPWLVWFTKDQADPYWFTAEQGEAMGLTPPEPAPLVVTCNGHSIELSDDEARYFAMYYPADMPSQYFKRVSGAVKLAGLLRDARHDPQPASADSDTLDFDAMPVGTVLRCTWNGEAIRIKIDGGVWSHNGVNPSADLIPANWEVVYQPGPVSPAEGLRAVLAGRDDADELIADPSQFARTWMMLVLDAARAARSGGAT